MRRRFDHLTVDELHAILALRQRVFVVEQGCAFAEIDGLDPLAEHWWTYGPGGEVACYLRVLDVEVPVRIGRVVTAPEHRGAGVGAALMRAALATIDGPVVLGAQVRVRGFYERLGFLVDGPEYDEDGIPHVPMRRALPARGVPSRHESGGILPSRAPSVVTAASQAPGGPSGTCSPRSCSCS